MQEHPLKNAVALPVRSSSLSAPPSSPQVQTSSPLSAVPPPSPPSSDRPLEAVVTAKTQEMVSIRSRARVARSEPLE
ncbi:uncharacterized protein K489DRAFT_378152 [Dissoconium aciculare CBS 342.82]|uniref:Uncharacterized protein n=1 Tax=Dissoconium aciculare CBS 342.82 TaxID=1314786 RepID=A0A6J3MC80_9PEZI|nr:uncharacterized protein K489DRAFT_378152 [Dissoconium aciculare CBS 342.82]KAF1825620.1 hypothetical protein K489DRAFT_378152 [Dissoconium aciculare CBS 342.82]